MTFLDIVWFIFIWSLFVSYLVVLFKIVGDLIGDRSLRGSGKALWILVLVLFPLVSALVYMLVRGDGMADRALERAGVPAPPPSSAQEIAQAKLLLDAGAVSQAEFERLKAGAFSNRAV
jgi:hypothetical protein